MLGRCDGIKHHRSRIATLGAFYHRNTGAFRPNAKLIDCCGAEGIGRTYKEGKHIGWKDGFRAIWCILKYR